MRQPEKKVKPIRSREDVHRVAEYLRDSHETGEMLRVMFLLGCNTGLRAGDLRRVKFADIVGKEYFDIIEAKTQKHRRIYINTALREIIQGYVEYERVKVFQRERTIVTVTEFFVQDKNCEIITGNKRVAVGVKYMHLLISDACRELGIEGNYGSHTMRKTFAYHVYKLCHSLDCVQRLLRHSNRKLTIRYILDRRSLKYARKEFKNSQKENPPPMSERDLYEINLI